MAKADISANLDNAETHFGDALVALQSGLASLATIRVMLDTVQDIPPPVIDPLPPEPVPPVTVPPITTPPPTSRATPSITVAPPVLNAPAIITSTKMLSQPVAYTFANRKTDPANPISIAYKATDGIHIPLVDISDHDLTGAAGLIRLQTGIIDELRVRRVRLTNGRYAPGVIAGLVLVGHATVTSILVEDCEYDRVVPITSSGDIYAGLFTGGGHAKTSPDPYGASSGMIFRNVKVSNCWTNYPAGSTDYPNSDGWVAESSFSGGQLINCEFRHGADAGVDRKSPNTFLQGVVLEDWRESLKTWCDAQDKDVYSFYPRHAHHVVTPQNARLNYRAEFQRFVGKDPNIPLFDMMRNGGNLQYDEVDLSGLPSGQVLAIVSASTALGSTIKLGSKAYTIDKNKVML